MLAINEKKTGKEVSYECTVTGGNTSRSFVVRCQAVSIPKNGRNYYMIYNTDMQVWSDAFGYVNNELASKSENTRIKANEALKFLLCYQEIVGKRIEDFTQADVSALKYFLEGYAPAGTGDELRLKTVRSNETVNGYLSVYRGFLTYLGVVKHPLFQTKTLPARHGGLTDEGATYSNTAYRSNNKVSSKTGRAPHYISFDEFNRIIDYVQSNNMVVAEIIIRLMYECGLRIGEVLGLTNDDLVDEVQSGGDVVYVAYLRNRVSDHKDQNAKTCMKVYSRKQYSLPEYSEYGYGYQTVSMHPELYALIIEYINDAHVSARENERSNARYVNKSLADRVRPAEGYEDDNFYIFINSIGTPLSVSSWNVTLRKILKECGIPVDKGSKKEGLNHKFRSGFAMFHVQYCHVQPLELATLLRHNGTASLNHYYKPTVSDEIEMKNRYVQSVYDMCPALKREDL